MSADLDRPLTVKICYHMVQFHFVEEIYKFKTAHFSVVCDPFVLPSPPTEKLVRTCQEQDESQWQESDNYEEDQEQTVEKSRHVWISPHDQVSDLLEEVRNDVHPLEREISTFLGIFVLAPPAQFLDIVGGSRLLDHVGTLLALEQEVD